MIFPVLLVDATARGTLPGRVARIDKRDRNAGTLRLVDDEATELGECPIAKPCSFGPAGRNPAADTLEVLKSQSATGAFSIKNERLRYAVVDMFLEPRLFSGEFAETPLGGFSASLLQAAPSLRQLGPDTLNICAGPGATVAIHSKRNDAEIDAKPILGIELGRFRDVASRGQYPLATDETEINLALAVGHQSGLMLAHYNGHGDAAFDGPDADGCTVTDEADYAIVVGLGSVLAEHRRNIAVNLEGICHFGNRADGSLGGQSVAGSQLGIAELVQVELAEHARIKSGFCQPRRGLVAADKRGRQRNRCGLRRNQLNSGYQLHAFKYRTSVTLVQERRAPLSAAIPPCPERQGFSRRL